MKFIEPSFKELYDTLINNSKLEKFFIENHILNTIDDYYENYGYNNNSYDANTVVSNANKIVYEQLTEVLLINLNYIKTQSIKDLIAKRYLATEIRDALNFASDIEIANDILWEIFYCAKYCFTSSFFQNNWEYFVPDCDFSEMQKNDSLMAFMDAIMKEFDKLDNIMSDVKKYRSYRDIPYDYIVYLSQLMGIEPKDFMIMEDQKEKFRTIIENIMDVYSIRGLPDSFELLFNFLGYNIKIEEYFFDRRKYFDLTEANEETTSADMYSFKYYLTTKDPRNNILDEVATGEIVTPEKMTEKLNIRDFDELVEKYGLMCVLGYDDEYIYENKIDGKVVSVDVKKYTGPVYKYFRTNYIRVRPTLKYSNGNFSLNQLYQISAVLDFLTPEFLQRETYIIIDIGSSEEEMILNWTKDYNADGFYMLDSESWKQNLAEKYIVDYNKENGYSRGFVTKPYVLNDLGKSKEYYNSLGVNSHYANNKYNNVFFNPLSEKIKIINTTKYWGDKVKFNNFTQKAYPVYRIDENLTIEGKKYYNPNYKVKNKQITELYLPADYNYVSKREQEDWDNMETVGLNGFNGSSLKNKIREMTYRTNSYYDFSDTYILKDENGNIIYREQNGELVPKTAKTSLGVINIDYVIDEDIKTFLDTSIDEKEWSENKKFLFKKEWKKIENFTWKVKFTFPVKDVDFLNGFVAKNKNVINYDYINKKLFCFNEFYNLSFKEDGDYEIINEKRNEYNNDALELLNRMISPGNYFISLNKYNSSYEVYQYEPLNKYKDLYINKYYPVPIKKQNSENLYTFTTFKDLIDSIDNNIFVYNNKKIDLSLTKNINFYVINDQSFYRPVINTTFNKKIIHTDEITKLVNSLGNFSNINNDEKKLKNNLGSFCFYPLDTSELDDLSLIRLKRKNILEQYKYKNIKSGLLIYSKTEEKLYRIINNGVYVTNNELKVTGKLNNIKTKEECVIQNGGIFGVEEINFYGRFVLNNNSAKIYEYDERYYGFSEQDDDDNFIFNNYDRIYEWDALKIYSKDEYGKRDKIKSDKYKKDSSYTEITNKRPIKVNIDRIYEEKDVDNIISNNILKEICESYGSSYSGYDNVTPLN